MSNDSNNRLPLYAQVENVIIGRISNGSLPPGTRLPSEDSLAQEYAVSRTTIRAAIQSLVQRGLVEIRRNQVPSWDSGIAENPLRPGSWQESCEGPAQIGVKISFKGVGVTALS